MKPRATRFIIDRSAVRDQTRDRIDENRMKIEDRKLKFEAKRADFGLHAKLMLTVTQTVVDARERRRIFEQHYGDQSGRY